MKKIINLIVDFGLIIGSTNFALAKFGSKVGSVSSDKKIGCQMASYFLGRETMT